MKKIFLGKLWEQLTEEEQCDLICNGFTVEKINNTVYFKFPCGLMLKSVYSKMDEIPFDKYNEEGFFSSEEVASNSILQPCEPFEFD